MIAEGIHIMIFIVQANFIHNGRTCCNPMQFQRTIQELMMSSEDSLDGVGSSKCGEEVKK